MITFQQKNLFFTENAVSKPNYSIFSDIRTMVSLTFKKQERLKSKKTIELIFKDGKSVSAFPLKAFWTEIEDNDMRYPAKMGVSVPKKSFRKAVSRNKIKRLIREAYRSNKNTFYEYLEENEKKIALMIIYIGKDQMSFEKIENAMKELFLKFKK